MSAVTEKITPAREVAVSLRGVSNSFGPNVIHENLDLDIYKNEILGLIGGSGAGKSVLLRAILWLRPPQAGEISVMGANLKSATDEDWQRIRRQWGVLFQDGALFSSLTVEENIEAPLREFTSLSKRLMREIAAMKIHMVGLPPKAATLFPSELSGGMRKRAGLARALALDPALLFLDEPTAGLDPLGAAAFDELLLSLRDTLGLTVCMVTHDLDSLHAVCDRIAVLAEKHIYATGTIAELTKNPYPWIQEYFNGPRGRAVTQKDCGTGGGNHKG
ncbi:ABC transporter related [uncultured delta proteobacterium]|uniref:ABC transporter related n=1 Tax=uncultured delta proteobacterium TaxID=34034 RepID=A0A212JY03_9DELT|nr:ABC transporter related [uncultured delta proteobacterium]